MKRYILPLFFLSCLFVFSQTKISFDYIGNFNDGLAPVKKGERWGFIDKDGKLVIELKYMAGFEVPEFSNGLCGIYSPEHDARGYINTKGEVVAPFIFDGVNPFFDSLTVVYRAGRADGSSNARQSIIHKNGKIVLETAPNAYNYETYFKEGLARVMQNFKCGFMDYNGKIVIETKYDDVMDFSEGLAAVKQASDSWDSKWGFIDKNGKVVIDFLFSHQPTNFSSGRAFIKGNDGKFGIIDAKGKVLVEPKYNQAFPFENGFATVSYTDAKWQTTYEIIDINGKVIKSFTREKSGSETILLSGFKNGLAVAMKSGKYGLIDTKGNVIVNFIFMKLNQMNDDRAYAELFDQKTKSITSGYIDKNGKFVIINEKPKF